MTSAFEELMGRPPRSFMQLTADARDVAEGGGSELVTRILRWRIVR